jgi:hypothetical protein
MFRWSIGDPKICYVEIFSFNLKFSRKGYSNFLLGVVRLSAQGEEAGVCMDVYHSYPLPKIMPSSSEPLLNSVVPFLYVFTKILCTYFRL